MFYGAGQIINGILCKRYNKRAACFISVCLSSILNAAAFFDIPFFWLYILWPLNAAAQSILYPSVMLTISEKVEKKYLAAASVIMAAATTVGTFASYGISALFSLPQNFKYSFIIAAPNKNKTNPRENLEFVLFFTRDYFGLSIKIE